MKSSNLQGPHSCKGARRSQIKLLNERRELLHLLNDPTTRPRTIRGSNNGKQYELQKTASARHLYNRKNNIHCSNIQVKNSETDDLSHHPKPSFVPFKKRWTIQEAAFQWTNFIRPFLQNSSRLSKRSLYRSLTMLEREFGKTHCGNFSCTRIQNCGRKRLPGDREV
ncbi:uncharacterized protein BKA78DRAFT_84798 [Phyllosticta capitalensis]|uniref:uncharacterized protein n=1 Tax=Phyllosticta capitalensis TaxID=121624 RepID=UPI0031328C2F